MKILVAFAGQYLFNIALYAHLPLQLFPEKDKRYPGLCRDILPLGASIVGEKSKAPGIEPLQKDDPGMRAYRAFFDKYLQGADITNGSYLTGYQQGVLLEQILKQCGDDLSRKNILAQAKNLKDVVVPTVLPGIKVNTSETENMIWTQMRLQRWTGTTWQAFGDVLDARSE